MGSDPRTIVDAGRRGENFGALLIAASSIGFGLNPYLATQAFAEGVSPEVTTLGRTILPLLCLLPFLPQALKYRRLMWVAILSGFVMSIGNLAYFRAVEVVPIATASLIFYTYPLFGLAYGVGFFGHRISRPQIIGAVMILLGAAIALSHNLRFDVDLRVLLSAFLAPVCHGLALNLFSTSLSGMPPLPKMVCVSIGSFSFLLPVTLLSGQPLLPTGTDATLAVASLGFFGVLIPAVLFLWGAPKAGLGKTAILSGVEFVVALLSGWVLLAQPVTFRELTGAGIILTAAVLIAMPRRKRDRAPRTGNEPGND